MGMGNGNGNGGARHDGDPDLDLEMEPPKTLLETFEEMLDPEGYPNVDELEEPTLTMMIVCSAVNYLKTNLIVIEPGLFSLLHRTLRADSAYCSVVSEEDELIRPVTDAHQKSWSAFDATLDEQRTTFGRVAADELSTSRWLAHIEALNASRFGFYEVLKRVGNFARLRELVLDEEFEGELWDDFRTRAAAGDLILARFVHFGDQHFCIGEAFVVQASRDAMVDYFRRTIGDRHDARLAYEDLMKWGPPGQPAYWLRYIDATMHDKYSTSYLRGVPDIGVANALTEELQDLRGEIDRISRAASAAHVRLDFGDALRKTLSSLRKLAGPLVAESKLPVEDVDRLRRDVRRLVGQIGRTLEASH